MVVNIDGNYVSLLHQGNGAAHGRLRGYMADGSAPGSAGEPPVRDQGHRRAQTHAGNRGGGI